MDVAEKADLIDGDSRKAWEKYFYVPFYREIEDGRSGPTISSGLLNQKAFEHMKGGKDATRDLLENTLSNWAHLLAASAKNRAAVETMRAAEAMGVATKMMPRAVQMGRKPKDAVTVRVKGKEASYQISDPMIVDALSAMDSTGFKGPVADFLTKTKRLLTIGVTADPTFKFWRNMLRDSVSSMAIAGLSYNPFANAMNGWKALGSSMNPHMLAGGATFRFGTSWENERALHAKRLIDQGVKDDTILDTPTKIKNFAKTLWEQYQEAGDKVENMNRAALYKLLREQGKSHLEASYQARDLMDFGLTGASASVRFLTQTVPFMNARLQGMYKLGRAAKEDPRRMLAVTAGVVAASAALLLVYDDDEDWKRREDWDRETYWWFKVGDTAFRIPKPFEIGAIGTIAERSLEFALDDEMTNRRFRERLGAIVWHQLSMNPVPQAFKPAIDIYANKDSFTGRPIEGLAMKRMLAPDRYTEGTSEIARQLGKAGGYTGLSPVQIDHLIRAYFGWVGAAAASIVDLGARPLLDRPDRAEPMPILNKMRRSIAEDLTNDPVRSRYVTQFYDQSQRIVQAAASMKEATKRGETERAAALDAKYGGNLSRQARQANRMRLRLSDLANERREIERSDKSALFKRRAMVRIGNEMDALAEKLGPLI